MESGLFNAVLQGGAFALLAYIVIRFHERLTGHMEKQTQVLTRLVSLLSLDNPAIDPGGVLSEKETKPNV